VSPAQGVIAVLPWLDTLQCSTEGIRELQARVLYSLTGYR